MGAPRFLENEEAAGPSENSLQTVRDKCRELGRLKDEIYELEKRLSELKDDHNDLAMRELPAMFDSLGIDIVGDASNQLDYVLKPYYKANLPKENPEPGLEWLDKNGHSDLIKCRVTVEFPKGLVQDARELANDIRERFNLGVKVDEGVHHMTLTSFVRNSVESGDDLPLEILGATVGNIVTVKEKR